MESDHTYKHELRLNRATYHLQTLKGRVQEWLDQDPYHYVTEPDPQGEKTIAKVLYTVPPPAEFRLMIGDCLHNLRASLDNLVYELAVQHTGRNPLPENLASGLLFPIVDRLMTPDEFRSRYKGKIGLLDPGAQPSRTYSRTTEGKTSHLTRSESSTSSPTWTNIG